MVLQTAASCSDAMHAAEPPAVTAAHRVNLLATDAERETFAPGKPFSAWPGVVDVGTRADAAIESSRPDCSGMPFLELI